MTVSHSRIRGVRCTVIGRRHVEASGRVSLALSVEQSCLHDGELRPPRVLPGGIVRRITGIMSSGSKNSVWQV